jgi:atypical dual specificity phosphatase
MLSFPQQKWQLTHALMKNSQSDDVNLIIDRLYLGNWGAARDEKQLTELGVTHIVSVLDFPPDIPNIIRQDNRLHIRINDTVNTDILCHLEETTNFIKAALDADENNKVLVSLHDLVTMEA